METTENQLTFLPRDFIDLSFLDHQEWHITS